MKKRKLLGIPVMVALVFGMMVVGCDSGSGGRRDTNFLDMLGLSMATPSQAALDVAGLTPAEFNDIVTAGAGGFRGWALYAWEDEYYGDEGEEFIMAWTGRDRFHFEAVLDLLDDLFGGAYYEFYGSFYSAWGYGFDLNFFPARFAEDGFYVTGGTLFLMLGNWYSPSYCCCYFD